MMKFVDVTSITIPPRHAPLQCQHSTVGHWHKCELDRGREGPCLTRWTGTLFVGQVCVWTPPVEVEVVVPIQMLA